MNQAKTQSVQSIQRQLEKEFPESQILKRPSDGGKLISYLEAASVVQRLNSVFGINWNLEILSEQIINDEIVVKLRLKISDANGTFIKEAFGGMIRKRRKNGDGFTNALADDLKAAQSDALKKAASYLGIGLYLYSSTGFENYEEDTNYVNECNSAIKSDSISTKEQFREQSKLPANGKSISSQPAPAGRPVSSFRGRLFNNAGSAPTLSAPRNYQSSNSFNS